MQDSNRELFKPITIIYFSTIAAQLISLGLGRIDTTSHFLSNLLPSLLFLTILTIPSAWIGIKLGRLIGLGVPIIDALLGKKAGAIRQLIKDVLIASILGFTMGAILLVMRFVCEPYLPSEIPRLGHRGIVGGLSVSFGAAIAEEVWFRLGLMTLLVWIFKYILSQQVPSNAVFWGVIVITSTCFGIAHLPQLISYEAGTSFAVWATLLGNILVGILYGWCYWKRSLIAAVVAHLTVDLVLHVLSVTL
tara:strand:- start:749 stop:1492 length:744 start_codon:yes stop_codon:yes gene_type:complete